MKTNTSFKLESEKTHNIWYRDSSGNQIWGPHKNLRGDVSELRGDVSGLRGRVSGFFVDCTNISGYVDAGINLKSKT
jgi:hypothetical protein